MSASAKSPVARPDPGHPVSGLLNAGILGMALGAGSMFLIMYCLGYRIEDSRRVRAPREPEVVRVPAAVAVPAAEAPPNGKRRLASLVGRMELLSRENLDLHLALDQDQAAQIAARLNRWANAEGMTYEEAEEEYETLRSLLTLAQNETLDKIGMPRGAGGMPLQDSGEYDENPFLQEINRKRLLDFLDRLPPPSKRKYAVEEGSRPEEENSQNATAASQP